VKVEIPNSNGRRFSTGAAFLMLTLLIEGLVRRACAMDGQQQERPPGSRRQ